MKKFIALITVLACVLMLSGCTAEEISLLYSEFGYEDNFNFAVNKTANCCFVSNYDCTEYTEDMELTVPDEFNGVLVKRLGGYFGRGLPCPFLISLSEYINAPEGSEYCGIYNEASLSRIDDEYTVENIRFILNIGKNIDTVEYVEMDTYYPHINDDGSITFYHPVVYINCSEENRHFYSKDGKLYGKATDIIIYGFAYAE